MAETVIGIDLGTTNCCLGVYRSESDSVEIIANNLGKNTTPSWVGFSAAGEIIIGERARTQPTWIYDTKRIIGKEFNDPELDHYKRMWDFNLVQGDRNRCQIDIPGQGPQDIEKISSYILQALKKSAEDTLNQPVTKAVITVPAYFNST